MNTSSKAIIPNSSEKVNLQTFCVQGNCMINQNFILNHSSKWNFSMIDFAVAAERLSVSIQGVLLATDNNSEIGASSPNAFLRACVHRRFKSVAA